MKKVYCDIRKCLGCASCEIACAVEHSKTKVLDKAIGEENLPVKRRKAEFVSRGITISTGCHHCREAQCVIACMSGAMYKDKKTHRTEYDRDRCVGCWMCVMSCAFGALTRDRKEKKVLKCDLCPDREVPACVESCPTGALFMGTLEKFKEKACNTR